MKVSVTVGAAGPGAGRVQDGLRALTSHQVLVGIPATTADARIDQVRKLAQRMGKTKRARVMAMKPTINNAELCYIHTHGSALRHIPARPIIEAAIEDKENNAVLGEDLGAAAKAALDGKPDQIMRELKTTAMDAQNRVKGWFTNPRNHWAPNAPSTIRRKGSSRPLIDTSALQGAMQGIVE